MLDHVRYTVYIGCKGADDPDPRNIIYMIHHIFNCRIVAIPLKFLYNTLGSLDPRLNVLDGIVLVDVLELLIEDLHLGLHLMQRCIIEEAHLLPGLNSVAVAN